MIVAVEGIISSGKTTFIELISDELEKLGIHVITAPEKVEAWVDSGLLRLAYDDPSRWSATMQMRCMFDCFESLRDLRRSLSEKACGPSTNSVVALCERSPTSNRIFGDVLEERGYMNEIECALYEQQIDFLSSYVDPPDAYVYLRTPVETCMNRMKQRGRDGEEGVSRSYQETLWRLHETRFGLRSKALQPVLRIEASDMGYFTDATKLTDVAQRLLALLRRGRT